jgi:hypothetical protein
VLSNMLSLCNFSGEEEVDTRFGTIPQSNHFGVEDLSLLDSERDLSIRFSFVCWKF